VQNPESQNQRFREVRGPFRLGDPSSIASENPAFGVRKMSHRSFLNVGIGGLKWVFVKNLEGFGVLGFLFFIFLFLKGSRFGGFWGCGCV